MNCFRKKFVKRFVTLTALFVLIPLIIFLGVWLLDDRNYKLISLGVAILSCVPFFVRFEKGTHGARELTVVAVMTAFSVIGRMIFAPIPGFKPVTAMTIISGVALGPEAGFLIGSLTAVISDFSFGLGPWTPFQMVIWGLIGFASGLIFRKVRRPSKIAQCIAGALGGVLFSLFMDLWSTVSMDGVFSLSRYLAAVAASFSFMVIYAVSNVIFLLILADPFLEKLNRIKRKYDIFRDTPSETRKKRDPAETTAPAEESLDH